MKIFLLRCLNHIGSCYAYLGLIYALYFIYFIVVPTYHLSYLRFIVFNITFLYFFSQGYLNLILTRFASFSLDKKSNYYSERSHYCKLCQSYIPIRDHHCFFVGTCIGQHNLRYFLLMLFHLLCAHLIGYSFVCHYLWNEIGGFHLINIFKILFFNIGYLIGFVETKWQAFICLHHYLAYFDFVFISKLFYNVMTRALNGQTQYEEKRMIVGNKQTFSQIFGSNKWILIFPFIRS